MRHFLTLLFLGLWFGACAQNPAAEARLSPIHQGVVFPAKFEASPKSVIRVMTWNVEHLVDSLDDPYVRNRREDQAQIDSLKMQSIAAVLASADADLVILQEAESANAVEAAAKQWFPELEYRYFADARSRNWYQNVVIMSKFPLGVMYSYGQVHTPLSFEEEGKTVYQTQDYINTRMWACDVLVSEEYALLVMGLHLKAGRKARDIAMRLGQIQFLKGQIASFEKSYRRPHILVAGDLNATPESEELLALTQNSRKAGRLLDPISNSALSHPADEPSRRLDYLLCNPRLAKNILPESAVVFSPLEAHVMRQASDHLPLILDIRLP